MRLCTQFLLFCHIQLYWIINSQLLRYQKTNHEDIDFLEHKRIVGGEEVKLGRYPYQVGLVRSFGRPFCGGSLIAPQWVLSAAHCKGYANFIHIGRHDYSNFYEEYESIPVEQEIVHPHYFAPKFHNDFMLIKLSTPSNYSYVKLDDGSADMKWGTDLFVTGWGTTSQGGDLSDVLREVRLDYFPSLLCFIAYIIPFGGITCKMFCARREGRDSCQGDSGGPILIKGNNATEDIQVGITSWGIGCAFLFYPGVYSKVSSAKEFIEDHVTFM